MSCISYKEFLFLSQIRGLSKQPKYYTETARILHKRRKQITRVTQLQKGKKNGENVVSDRGKWTVGVCTWYKPRQNTAPHKYLTNVFWVYFQLINGLLISLSKNSHPKNMKNVWDFLGLQDSHS